MFTPGSKPSPGMILETRRARVISNSERDTGLFDGWGPRMGR